MAEVAVAPIVNEGSPMMLTHSDYDLVYKTHCKKRERC